MLDDDQHLPSLIAEARRLKKKHKKKDKKKRKPTPAAPASAWMEDVTRNESIHPD